MSPRRNSDTLSGEPKSNNNPGGFANAKPNNHATIPPLSAFAQEPIELLSASCNRVQVDFELLEEEENLRLSVWYNEDPEREDDREQIYGASICLQVTPDVDRDAAEAWLARSARTLDSWADDADTFENRAVSWVKSLESLNDKTLVADAPITLMSGDTDRVSVEVLDGGKYREEAGEDGEPTGEKTPLLSLAVFYRDSVDDEWDYVTIHEPTGITTDADKDKLQAWLNDSAQKLDADFTNFDDLTKSAITFGELAYDTYDDGLSS